MTIELSGHAVATATVRAALAALLGGAAGLLLLVVLGAHLVRRRVTLPLAALGASLEAFATAAAPGRPRGGARRGA